MLSWMSRSLLTKYSFTRFSSAFSNLAPRNHFSDQLDYINSVVDGHTTWDWPSIKSNILSYQGNINQKNCDGYLIKVMVTNKKLEAALSFANHLMNNSEEMTLGSVNGLLGLYYEIGRTRKLSEEEKTFIKDSYKSLYEKYKALDFFTCEKLLLALCVVDEWEKAMWVLEDIYITSIPSHNSFSTLIGTLFKNDKKKKALEIISESLKHKRPLLHVAFEEWINYILRKYKDKNTILKRLGDIHEHILRNYAVVDEMTARKLQETYSRLGWEAEFTTIRKNNGECTQCKETLDCLKLSDADFLTLQQNVKEKLIVGSNLFLKSSPEELKKFLRFMETTAPYDIVLDTLNVAYAVRNGSPGDRVEILLSTVDYFKQRNKKILLLGRRHMLKWGKGSIQKLMSSTSTFLTDDISQDDPYFITAAILSGAHTDIVSKDLLRGHQFNLQDDNLRYLFRKWQWQHQWRVYTTANKNFKVQPPLSFTPCAQKSENNGALHLPYQSEATKSTGQLNDGTPDLNSWLCIRRKVNK